MPRRQQEDKRMSDTLPATTLEERQLHAIGRRIDSVAPLLTAIARATKSLPAADQLAVQRRLRELAAYQETANGPRELLETIDKITRKLRGRVGESLREIRRAAMRNLSLGLVAIAFALVGIVPISHGMTRHLTSLNAGVHQLAAGNFQTRVPVRSRDEFGSLASAFNQMAADLEKHQALVIEQERLRRELELSRLIQTEMLPRAPLRLGTAEIKGISMPAREVGGDFFNYFALPDGRLALLVGDVSGKGVSAALLMANVQATLDGLLVDRPRRSIIRPQRTEEA